MLLTSAESKWHICNNSQQFSLLKILKSRLFVGRSRLSDGQNFKEPPTAWFWEGCSYLANNLYDPARILARSLAITPAMACKILQDLVRPWPDLTRIMLWFFEKSCQDLDRCSTWGHTWSWKPSTYFRPDLVVNVPLLSPSPSCPPPLPSLLPSHPLPSSPSPSAPSLPPTHPSLPLTFSGTYMQSLNMFAVHCNELWWFFSFSCSLPSIFYNVSQTKTLTITDFRLEILDTDSLCDSASAHAI